ncbi:hypothetical protein FW774_06070 [Pedobacter sp. BS3]|uniref:hypothetical protein n=1 Tax=Pedobacter sp. BS3 TaxID=2567937 RepID=UPI0011ED5A77|nr:hypothetical protein [Pedobacter sp. BS3]TZF84551.1 hypothetical protein FW774_06070 [Pedobacter sp. BS3]
MDLENSTQSDRLIQYIEYKGYSFRKAERLLGLGNGTIGKLKGELKPIIVDAIVNTFPDINRRWLETGEGDLEKPPGSTGSDRDELIKTQRDFIENLKNDKMELKAENQALKEEIRSLRRQLEELQPNVNASRAG